MSISRILRRDLEGFLGHPVTDTASARKELQDFAAQNTDNQRDNELIRLLAYTEPAVDEYGYRRSTDFPENELSGALTRAAASLSDIRKAANKQNYQEAQPQLSERERKIEEARKRWEADQAAGTLNTGEVRQPTPRSRPEPAPSPIQTIIRRPRQSASASAAISGERQRRKPANPVAVEGLEPWSAREGGAGKPLYYGASSIQEWKGREAQMMQQLNEEVRSGRVRENNAEDLAALTAEFNRTFGSTPNEVQRNLQAIQGYQRYGAQGALPRSVAESYSVAAAHADEKLGRALLELSGFDNAALLNSTNDYATDLTAQMLGRSYNIDSQKKLNAGRMLNLGAFKNIETPQGTSAFLASLDEDTKVLDALLDLQDASRQASQMRGNRRPGLYAGSYEVSGTEDKLMQSLTSDYNPNPSQSFWDGQAEMRKDGLLIADHSGLSGSGVIPGAGPFNSTMPAGGHTLLDLESLRGDLANMTLRDLQQGAGGFISPMQLGRNARKGLQRQAQNRGNILEDVKLKLPMSYIQQVNNNIGAIRPQALQQLGF